MDKPGAEVDQGAEPRAGAEPGEQDALVDSEGTTLWRCWRRFDPETVKETAEFSLYSTGELNSGLHLERSPVSVLPTMTTRAEGQAARVGVIRISESQPLSERVTSAPTEKTLDAGYHGGGSEDEVAALLSLATGALFRSGGMIRLWSENGGDPLGLPLEAFHRAPVWVGPAPRMKSILFEPTGAVDLDEAVDLLRRFPQLTGRNARTLVRAARLFANGMWVSDGDPNQAWIYFVSAVEAAAIDGRPETKGTKPVSARFAEHHPEVWDSLVSAGGVEHAEAVGTELAPMVRVTDRFLNFLDKYCPRPPALRPDAEAQLDYSDYRGKLTQVYDYRSRALHSGLPFPDPMCSPLLPALHAGEVPEEVPTWPWAGSGMHQWAKADVPMYLHTFVHIARGALLNWWRDAITQPA